MAKVLVVDDEPAIQRLVALRLRLGGHEVVLQVGTMQEALDAVAKIWELGIRIAIVDGAFPDPDDGASFAAALRAETPCVKIISFSANDKAQMWGDRNLRKPDDFPQLCQAVEELLKA